MTMIFRKESKLSFAFILLIVFVSLAATGCADDESLREDGKLYKEAFRELRVDMTIKEVEDLLEAPDKIIKDDDKFQEAMDWDNNNTTDAWSDDFYPIFYGSEDHGIKSFYKREKNLHDVICYEYKYYRSTGSEGIWHLYFLEGKLIYTYMP